MYDSFTSTRRFTISNGSDRAVLYVGLGETDEFA